jgi:acyl-coenzyme A synthetase/AMP-(fatty) acid ligase
VQAPVRGQEIVAFVVLNKGAEEVGADELREHCRRNASAYKVPHHILLCDALPTTSTGKLSRAGLKDEWHARTTRAREGASVEGVDDAVAARRRSDRTAVEQRGS